MPLPAQAKLLRVLQEGTVEPLGTNESTRVDVRIISATHRNLREAHHARGGSARTSTTGSTSSTSRSRRCANGAGDLPLLLQYFLQQVHAARASRRRRSRRAPGRCCRSSVPGNVREFAHAIEHAVVLAGGGEIDVEHLPAGITGTLRRQPAARPATAACARCAAALKEFEHEYLLRALAQANGKKMKAAEILGISRKNLWEKLRLHGIAAEPTPKPTRPED